MSVVRVGRTRQRVTKWGTHRTWTRIRFGDETRTLFVATSADVPFVKHDLGDIWLPVALIMAMKRGDRLVMADPISPQRRKAIDTIQDVFVSWYPEVMTRVKVRAPSSDAPRGVRRAIRRVADRARRRRREATCFTGGVDSFYSLLTNDDVGALVYAFGLDIPLSRKAASRRVDAELQAVAAQTGDALHTVRTNLRRDLSRDLSWGYESHGAVLACIGMVLSPVISTLRIPSTHTEDADIPWGSHPDLDPLWSTDRLTVIHDGGGASRAAKTVRLADEPLAQQHLRVCFKQFAQANCGRCMKCMRTMATLELIDRLDRFETFPEPLDLDLMRSQVLKTSNDAFQMRDVLSLAATVAGHDELEDVVAALVAAYDAQEGLAPSGGGLPPGSGGADR